MMLLQISEWKMEAQVGGLVMIGVIVIALMIIAITWRRHYNYRCETETFANVAIISGAVVAIVAIAGVIVFTPFKTDSLKWTQVQGTVVESTHDYNGYMTLAKPETRDVLVLEGSSKQYDCKDKLCAGAHEGDRVTMKCTLDIARWLYAHTRTRCYVLKITPSR